MKILIAAIGKAKASPELSLYHDFTKRIPWKIALTECKSNDQLFAACAGYDRLIALDETGRQFTSQAFAGQISTWQQQGFSSFAFIIGAADGLTDEIRSRAHLVWSLGNLTWPHMLVRGLLAEQLYRSYSILTNHPYHRS
ncbi:MAG: 23S rRNA (pseudouridine(1915)-N(3))-methyltransferase RlmH [Rickettsiales bacterium]|jgi:23S rRNA (pseudouridine1915-N3)-methyltransferase|nr:23S rRNA (pseudouridine(1915)-N(3))-methyltransferase RlmH [Rickettsiales bacterium]